MVSKVKQFFNKAGQGLKQAFSKGGPLDKAFQKGGTIDKTFQKGGSAEQLVNKIGTGIDTGLKTLGNVAQKAGGIASSVAPILASTLGPEAGAFAYGAGKIAQKVGKGVQNAQNIKQKAVQGFHNPNPILAPKPEPEASQEPAINFA